MIRIGTVRILVVILIAQVGLVDRVHSQDAPRETFMTDDPPSLRVQVIDVRPQTYEIELPFLVDPNFTRTVAAATDPSCGRNIRKVISFPTGLQSESLAESLLAEVGFHIAISERNSILIRSFGEGRFFSTYDLLDHQPAELSKMIYDRLKHEGLPLDHPFGERLGEFLSSKCGYENDFLHSDLQAWQSTLGDSEIMDDGLELRFAVLSSGVFGGIFIPNSPSIIDGSGRVHFSTVDGNIATYNKLVRSFRQYWEQVRRREYYSWHDALFLMARSRSSSASPFDASSFVPNETSQIPPATQYVTAIQNHVVDEMLASLAPIETALDQLTNHKREVVNLINDVPHRYRAAVSSGFSLEWQGIGVNSFVTNQYVTDLENEEAELWEFERQLREFERTPEGAERRAWSSQRLSRLNLIEQIERMQAEHDRAIETHLTLAWMRGKADEIGNIEIQDIDPEDVFLFRPIQREMEFDNQVFSKCMPLAFINGEVNQINLDTLIDVVGRVKEDFSSGSYVVSSPISYEFNNSCDMVGTPSYETFVTSALSANAVLLPRDRRLALRVATVAEARSNYQNVVNVAVDGLGNLTNHLQNVRRETAMFNSVVSELTSIVAAEFIGRIVSSDQTYTYGSIVAPSGGFDGQYRNLQLVFPESSIISASELTRHIRVESEYGRTIYLTGNPQSREALVRWWDSRDYEPQPILSPEIFETEFPMDCPILVNDVSDVGQSSTLRLSVQVDRFCRLLPVDTMPYQRAFDRRSALCEVEACDTFLPFGLGADWVVRGIDAVTGREITIELN